MGLTPILWTRISPLATFDTDGTFGGKNILTLWLISYKSDFNINGGITTVGQVLTNWEEILGNASTIDTGFIVLEHDLFQQAVDIATGYILPDALAAKKFQIEPVITCLNKPLADAYIETNDNKTNPPVASGTSCLYVYAKSLTYITFTGGAVTLSSGAPGSAQPTGASGSSASSSAIGVDVGFSLLAAFGTAAAGLIASTCAVLL